MAGIRQLLRRSVQMPTSPIHTQEIALRNAYAEGDAERCAVHHLNLANQLEHAAVPETLLAHRLAGGVILFQADLPLLTDALANLANELRARAAPRQPPLPRCEFDDLCALVEAVDGVHFADWWMACTPMARPMATRRCTQWPASCGAWLVERVAKASVRMVASPP